MIVICAGTTGYNADVDLRYLWSARSGCRDRTSRTTRGERLQRPVLAGKIDPCVSRVFKFDETGACHQLMYENRHPDGNMVILVGAPAEGMTTIR